MVGRTRLAGTKQKAPTVKTTNGRENRAKDTKAVKKYCRGHLSRAATNLTGESHKHESLKHIHKHKQTKIERVAKMD